MSWSDRQARDIVKAVRKHYGVTGHTATENLREAMLAQHCMGVIVTQDADTLQTLDINALWNRVRIEAGILHIGEKG